MCGMVEKFKQSEVDYNLHENMHCHLAVNCKICNFPNQVC